MRKIQILISVFFILAIIAPYAGAQPKVLVEHPVYSFESVAEGVRVSHNFIVKNIGDTLLRITDVKPP